MGNRKMKGFYITTAAIFTFAMVLAFKMNPDGLVTLAQFYLGAQGITTAGFFGFNFGEHWASAKKANGK